MFVDLVFGGNGEKQVDDGGGGGQQIDLEFVCVEVCGVYVQKVDCCVVQNVKLGDVEIEVDEVGTIFFRDVGLSKQVETYGGDYNNFILEFSNKIFMQMYYKKIKLVFEKINFVFL